MRVRSTGLRAAILRPASALLLSGLLLFANVSCAEPEAESVPQPEPDGVIEQEAASATPTATAEAATAAATSEMAATQIDGDGLYLAWSYDTGEPINHPPLYVNGLLFVAPSEEPLLALDAQTGTIRWTYDPPQRIWDRAYATDGELLFVGIEGGGVVALEVESGRQVWLKELEIDVQVPPLVSGDVLYVPTTFVGTGLSNDPSGKAKLYALEISTGHILWSFESDNYILQSPFLVGDALYAAGVFYDVEPVDEGGHTRLYKLSAEDGTVHWHYESEDGFPKQLYATESTVAFIAYQDFANGIDAVTGELRWRRDTGNWVPNLTGAEGVIYFGSANTVVHALEMANGDIVWQHNIPEGTFNYLLGAPVPVGDELLFLTQHGDIMGLDMADGSLRWQFPTNITSRTGLSVAGNQLFIGDENGVVYAYVSP